MTWSKIASTKYNNHDNGGTTPAIDTSTANLIVVTVRWYTPAAEPVFSDSKGNTWIAKTLRTQTVGSMRKYYCITPTVGTGHTFSLTGTGNVPDCHVLALRTDSAGSISYDVGKEAGTSQSSGTSIQPGSLTPSANNAVMVIGCESGGTAPTIDSSFAREEVDAYVAPSQFGGLIAWKEKATAGAENPTINWSTNVNGDASVDMLVFLAGITTPIGITTTFADGETIPVDNGQVYASVAVSFTWDQGLTTPDAVELQGYLADGTTISQAWFSPQAQPSFSGSPSTATWRLPGGKIQKIKVRTKAGVSVIETSAASSNSMNGVGTVLAQCGQSHHTKAESTVSSPPAANASGKLFDGTTWSAPAGNGNIAQLNSLVAGKAGQGCGGTDWPFAIVTTGVGGAGWSQNDSGIGSWLTAGGTAPFGLFKTKVAAVRGGKVNGIIAIGGSSDASEGKTQTEIYTDQQTVRAAINSWIGLTSAQLPWYYVVNGRANDAGGTTDAEWNGLMVTDTTFPLTETNAPLVACFHDLPLIDEYHLTAAGYATGGHRIAQGILKAMGAAAYDGASLRVTSAYRLSGSADIFLPVTSDAGYVLTATDGSKDGASLTGFDVSIDGFTNLLTIASTLFSGNLIRIRLAAAPPNGATVQVRYLYGALPTLTKIVFDNLTPGGDSQGRPLLPIAVPITVAVRRSLVGGRVGLRLAA